MGKESIIAQVDYGTEKIMKDISDDIIGPISDTLQDIKDKTNDISDIYDQTKEITEKLCRFDGLSSSLSDLREFAQESKKLAEKITPFGIQLQSIQTKVEKGIEDGNSKSDKVIVGIGELHSVLEKESSSVNEILNAISKIHNAITSVGEKQTNKFAEVSEVLRKTEEKNIINIERNYKSIAQCREDVISLSHNLESIAEKTTSLLKILDNRQKEIQDKVNCLSQKIQSAEENVINKANELNTRIESVQNNIKTIAENNELQINNLKESIDKVQVTLDIVVNLTTPFWKKWGK